MQNNRRQFHIYDLELAARKKGAAVPTMNEVLPAYQRLHAAGRTQPIRASSGTLLIGDIEINAAQQFATILVRLSDKLTPNSVYSDPAAGAFDEHVKGGNVGSDFGCHVLISTAPEKNMPNVYTCAIERVPGLPAELVRRVLSKFLNFEFSEVATSFAYPHPAGGKDKAGNPRMERCCPHVELRGRASDTLASDINNGKISGITLIKAEPVTPFGGTAYLKKSTSELKLDVDHNSLPANLWGSLKTTLNQNSQTYGKAKISYKIPGSTRQVTVDIDAASGSPISEMYIRSFELTNIFPFLAQSAKKIVPHLRDLAVPQFIANRTI